MIPKLVFTFWEGDNFTYLQALTLITLSKLNPDLMIHVYYSDESEDKADRVRWCTHEQSIDYPNRYDIHNLGQIRNLTIIPIDVYSLLKYHKRRLTSVWKSDIVRIIKLCEHGGMYIDFDVLFIKPIPTEFFDSDKIMFNTYHNVVNNAIIISDKHNPCLYRIRDKIYEKLSMDDIQDEYMQFGPRLITGVVQDPCLEEHVSYLPNDYTCPYLWNETYKLFFTNIDQTTVNTFCIHWYNGANDSARYCAQFDIHNVREEHCVFERLLYNVIRTRYDFIEIGTAYFDTEIQIHNNRIGLSIDPIQEYLDRLPNVPNVTKICCAISDKSDEFVAYVPQFPSDYPQWLSGCVSVLTPHKHVIQFCNNVGIDYHDYVTTRIVNVMSVSKLIEEYHIGSVDFLKIDTEGHDTVILHGWLDCCASNKSLYPKKILFESKDLTPKKELDNINARLLSLKYTLTFYEYDTEAVLQI